jgi:hypothetical protein
MSENARELLSEAIVKFERTVQAAMELFHEETGLFVDGIDFSVHSNASQGRNLFDATALKTSSVVIRRTHITD